MQRTRTPIEFDRGAVARAADAMVGPAVLGRPLSTASSPAIALGRSLAANAISQSKAVAAQPSGTAPRPRHL